MVTEEERYGLAGYVLHADGQQLPVRLANFKLVKSICNQTMAANVMNSTKSVRLTH